MSNTTLVLGASADPGRYSFEAIRLLRRHGHSVVAIGRSAGTVADVPITMNWPGGGVDTVTMYLSPARQRDYYGPIVALGPRRVIFNPGSENMEFQRRLEAEGIACETACTLILLRTGGY